MEANKKFTIRLGDDTVELDCHPRFVALAKERFPHAESDEQSIRELFLETVRGTLSSIDDEQTPERDA